MTDPKPNVALDAANTLSPDMRDAILDIFKTQPLSWKMMSAAAQRELAQRLDQQIEDIIRRACTIIYRQNLVTVDADLDQATRKGNQIDLKVTMKGDHPGRHDVIDSVGQVIMLVVGADAANFMDSRPAEIEPDERPLPLDDDDGSVFDRTPNGRP